MPAKKKSSASSVAPETKKLATQKAPAKKAPAKKAAAKKAPTKKATAKKAPTGKAAAPKVAGKKKVLSAEEQFLAIQEAAYYMAEQHGFQGDPSDYWQAAKNALDF
jgi:hypothetical protein